MELQFLANHLRKAGFRVETPLLDGYSFGTGFSNWKDWVADAHREIDRLAGESGEKIMIGGLSMGATLALAVASQRDDIGAVVALSTTLVFDGWAIPWYRPLLRLGHALGFGKFYEYKERDPYGVKNMQLRTYVKKTLEQNRVSEVGGESFSLEHLVEGDRLIDYVTCHLQRVFADLLVIHAVDDEVASVRNADWVLEASRSAVKEAVFLGNSYHIVTVDNERETVCAEVEFFLKEALQRTMAGKVPTPILSQEYARLIRSKN